VTVLRALRVTLHEPDEAVARRVARLPTSLADGFAAATALSVGGGLHTTDRELAAQITHHDVAVTLY
jgi:predicted nucleic acid-binding protein